MSQREPLKPQWPESDGPIEAISVPIPPQAFGPAPKGWHDAREALLEKIRAIEQAAP